MCQLLTSVQFFAVQWTIACQATLSMEFSRPNTGMGSHSLPQGIFPTQGLNPGLLHGRKIIYHPSNQGSILLLPFNLNTVYMLYSNKNMFLIFKKRFKMMWAQVLISRFRRGWKSKFHFLHTASFNFLNKQ